MPDNNKSILAIVIEWLHRIRKRFGGMKTEAAEQGNINYEHSGTGYSYTFLHQREGTFMNMNISELVIFAPA